MKIRTATKDDTPQLIELKNPHNQEHKKIFLDIQTKRIQEMEDGRSVYLVAEKEHVIVGHIYLNLHGTPTEPGYPNMSDLYVAEKDRHQGIGSSLVHEAERITKKKGYQKISLAVNPVLNPKAKVLYEKLGYRQTDTKTYLDGVYDGDEDWVIDMVKELNGLEGS
jgi:ribosomal protein S18 acetylase RimI-like enzyme